MSRTTLPNIRIIPRESEFLDRKSGNRGEIFYDQDNNTLRLYDGRQDGGLSLAKGDLSNVPNSVLLSKAVSAGLASTTFVTTRGYITASSLTGLATETFVGTAISNIPEVDLTGYATETFVGTAISNIPEVDLTGYATETFVGTAISNLVDTAPTTLNTLNELAAALGDDANFATTVTTALGTKAPINNPTFTGTVAGITATMVGLGNVTNESKATMFTSPTFNGIVSLGVRQVVFDRTVGDNWIGTSVVIESGNISIFEPPTGFNNWLNSLEPGDQFTIQPGGQELTVASTSSNSFTFLITTEEVIDETPGESALPSAFWITSFTQNDAPATIAGVTKAMVGLGNVTNESKATMFADPTFTGLTTTGNLTVNGTASLTLPALSVDSSLVFAAGATTYDGSTARTIGLGTAVTGRFEAITYNLNAVTLTNSTDNQVLSTTQPVTFVPSASKLYIIETEFELTTTGTTSHTERITLVAPEVSGFQSVITRRSIGGTTASVINTHRVTAPGTTVITGALTTAQVATYMIRTSMVLAVGGTYAVQISFSAAPGGTSTVNYSHTRVRVSVDDVGLDGSF
jgi:hypothetical protein